MTLMIALLAQTKNHPDPGGFYLLCFLIAALVVTWRIHRRILRGLGIVFLILGLVAAVAALGGTRIPYGPEGSGITWPQIAGLLGGGLGLRVVGGLQPASWFRHRGKANTGLPR